MTDSIQKYGTGRRVRVDDVAREAGVSPITVSRALRTPEKVGPDTLAKVAEAVKKTGYVVNSIASSLRSGQSSIVTVFVASLQNPHFAAVVQGLLHAFEQSRFHLMFAQSGYSDMLTPEMVEAALPFAPAALAFTGVVRPQETRDSILALGVPVMEMMGEGNYPMDMLVGSSSLDGGRLMGAHFGAQGFRHVAYCGHVDHRGGRRLEGFTEGLAAYGIAPELVLPMEGTRGIGDGMAAFETIRTELPHCDAIFFGTDILAVGAILKAEKLGVSIPGDIALAGYGDLDFAAEIDPSLTSIQISDYQMGLEAGSKLLRRLNKQPVDDPVAMMPTILRSRASTGVVEPK